MLTGELSDAEKALQEMLALNAASPDQQLLSVFMLADVIEQQDRGEEALSLFESLKNSYPNKKVIEIRIAALRQKAAKVGKKK